MEVEEPKLSVQDFAAKIKAKYPEYKDIPDDELTAKVIAKHPEYETQVNTKKNFGSESISTAQETLGEPSAAEPSPESQNGQLTTPTIDRARQSIERRRQLLEQGVSDIIVKEPVYQNPVHQKNISQKIASYVEDNLTNIYEAGKEALQAPPMLHGGVFMSESMKQAEEGKSNIVGSAALFTKHSAESTAESFKKTAEKIKAPISPLAKFRDLTIGTAKTLMDAAITAGSVTPAGIAFVTGVDVLKEAGVPEKAIDTAMSLASSGANKMGILDENSPDWEKQLLSIFDIAILAGAGVGGKKAYEYVKKKVPFAEMPKEAQEEIVKGVENLTENDIQAHATHPESFDLARKEKEILDANSDLGKVGDDAKGIVQEKVNQLEGEKQQIEQQEVQGEIAKAHEQTLSEVKSNLETESQRVDISEPTKEILKQKMDEIKSMSDELKVGDTVEMEVKPSVQEIEKAPLKSEEITPSEIENTENSEIAHAEKESSVEVKKTIATTDSKVLKDLASEIPKSSEIKKYLSGETIEKYEGEGTLRNTQDYEKQELRPALEHGVKIIEAAKEEFGDAYVEKTLDFIEAHPDNIASKALMYVSLENNLAARKLIEPHNELQIAKLQDLVRAKSQAYLRANSIEINMGRLRKFAEVGYDVNNITEGFFSSGQMEGKKSVEKSIQADAKEIQKESERMAGISEIETLISEGVEKTINALYKKLPTNRRLKADRAILALERIQVRLRNKAYDATIGIPVAIIDAGITTIKHAIKAGVNIADAIELGINKIKEKYGKKWANEDKFRSDMLEGFKEEKIETGKHELTESERIENTKDAVRGRIEGIREEILGKQREVKATKSNAEDVELLRLRQEEAALKNLRDKYLPKEEARFVEEKKVKNITDKLTDEILDIEKQIQKGEKDVREAKQDPLQSPKIAKLKAEKKARLEILEQIDPSPKEFVKNALIEKGFGKEISIKGEKRQVVDWRKLAGEEGSVEKIKDNAESVLKEKGYSEGQIERMREAFAEEYDNIRASVIDRGLKELDKRNELTESERKSSAKTLAELYNYGLFEKKSDTYDYLLNKALGLGDVGQGAFFEAKKLAQSLSELYKSKNQGQTVSDLGVRHATRVINHEIEMLLTKVARNQSNGVFKAASITKEFMGLAQRNLLVSLKQLVENPMSGFIQRGFSKIGFSFDKVDSKALRQNRGKMARVIYEDAVRNGGLIYGDVTTPFVTHSQTVNWLNRQSNSKVYHTAVSAMIGRPFLEGADSMHKVALTEKYFTYNLIKVLTDPKNPNKMSKQEAVNYVSKQLTGQSFEQAKATATEIIETVNKKAGKEVISNNKQTTERIANDIIKDSLIKGEKLTAKEIESSYDAAYRAAGFDLGHEANNPISVGVSKLTASIEHEIKTAVKEKKWNEAAALTFSSILSKNILNPFVGGGTNWVVLTLQKSGTDFISPLYDYAQKKSNPIDITTEAGIKNMENAMLKNLRAKNTATRYLAGAAASIITYSAFRATGADDDIYKWLKNNEWARKYFNVISPQALVFLMYQKDEAVGKWFGNLLNIKTDNFDDGKKLLKAVDEISKGKTDKGLGKAGELVGGKTSMPLLPYKLARDVQNVVRGIQKKPQIKMDYSSEGFIEGYYQQGLVDYISTLIDPNANGKPKEATGVVLTKTPLEKTAITKTPIKK